MASPSAEPAPSDQQRRALHPKRFKLNRELVARLAQAARDSGAAQPQSEGAELRRPQHQVVAPSSRSKTIDSSRLNKLQQQQREERKNREVRPGSAEIECCNVGAAATELAQQPQQVVRAPGESGTHQSTFVRAPLTPCVSLARNPVALSRSRGHADDNRTLDADNLSPPPLMTQAHCSFQETEAAAPARRRHHLHDRRQSDARPLLAATTTCSMCHYAATRSGNNIDNNKRSAGALAPIYGRGNQRPPVCPRRALPRRLGRQRRPPTNGTRSLGGRVSPSFATGDRRLGDSPAGSGVTALESAASVKTAGENLNDDRNVCKSTVISSVREQQQQPVATFGLGNERSAGGEIADIDGRALAESRADNSTDRVNRIDDLCDSTSGGGRHKIDQIIMRSSSSRHFQIKSNHQRENQSAKTDVKTARATRRRKSVTIKLSADNGAKSIWQDARFALFVLVLAALGLSLAPDWRATFAISAAASSTTPRPSPTAVDLSRAILATMSTQSSRSNESSAGTSKRATDENFERYPSTATDPGDRAANYSTDDPPTLEREGVAPVGNASSPETQGGGGESFVWDQLLDFGRIFVMVAIIVGDICGNSLVILSVCRHSKLRVTTNWFVVSLACADILVALFAMTFNASVIVSGRWLFQPWMCDFWNSCDVLASTASILHLCCISIDRYIAIMRPLDYPMKITTRRVMYTLCGVWISSALLSYIPIFTGIYTTAEHIKWLEENPDQCEFVVNRVYAVVSSAISFWIPCCIMVFTYYRIYREATRQEKFIYKAQSIMPAPNHHHNNHHAHKSGAGRSKQRRSKSMAVGGSGGTGTAGAGQSQAVRIRQLAKQQEMQASRAQPLNQSAGEIATTQLNQSTLAVGVPTATAVSAEAEPLTGANPVDVNNNSGGGGGNSVAAHPQPPVSVSVQPPEEPSVADDDEQNSDSGQSTPTKRSISKMKREHKAAKTLGIIMGVFILCWLPFFSWYTPQHICGHACDGMVPRSAVTLLFWIGYFNSTLNPIIYAYFNHEFRDAFKKTLQWIFCCCQDLKCLRVQRPNDNQRYNCTYRSTQEIGLVNNS